MIVKRFLNAYTKLTLNTIQTIFSTILRNRLNILNAYNIYSVAIRQTNYLNSVIF